MDFLSLDRLPGVSLLRGNISSDLTDSVVKTLINKFDVQLTDFLMVPSLNVEAAQGIHDFTDFEPMGSLKLIAIVMEKATVRAQNSLLTLLETPPSRVKFVLFDAPGVLETIASRAEVFNLSSDVHPSKQAKAVVLLVVKTVYELNDIMLEDLFKNWDDEAHLLLLEWAVESKLHRPSVFSSEELELYQFSSGFYDNLIVALSATMPARGRLSAKSIMLSYVERSRGVK